MSTEEQLSLFAAGSPASHLALHPQSDSAKKMTEHSGRKCIESYKRYSQLGSLLKTCLESSTWNSTRCYLTWKTRVTPHKRLYFQLAASMPHIEEKESGSSRTAIWPTPDASQRGSRATDLVVNESIVQRRNSGQKRGIDLQTAAKLWPTPTANLSGEADFMESLVTKDGKPAQPGERAYSPKSGKHTSISLNRAVKMWPTPTQHGNNNRKGISKKAGDGLGTAVRRESLSGSLNPAWVEWLMGFPIGHTDLED